MPEGTAAPPRRWGKNRKRLLGGVATAVVVGAVFVFVLPRIADYGEVWDVLQDVGLTEALLLAGVTLLNLVTFAPPWLVALPGLRFRQAFVMTQASTALSLVSPAGAAVGMAGSYSMLRNWGFGAAPVALAVAVTGIWNQFANLAFPIVALVLLTGVDQDDPALRTAALVGLVVLVVAIGAFALALSSRQRARRIGDLAARLATRALRLFRRGPVAWGGESLARFRSGALGLLGRRWHVLTLTTLVGHLTVFLLLVVCLRVVGVSGGDVSWVEAFAAWSLVRILGALPLTPGGVGIVEVGLSGALVAFGASNADAVAATLLYRSLTVLPTLGLGMLAAATWRSHHPGDRLGSSE
ncbi:MAG TPA: lysylphosphatidylglycerol synthase transmembrane domain-containing protein [Gaiellaceae bacterium]|nr:lysylphosphatidylglycerol synthase transmembrane domain-containing protein [Gaiellaceae bacterium]